MFAGFGTAEDTNVRFRELLRSGSDGLSVAFDLPTLMGRDSDDPLAEGEVGRCGVAVDTLADVEDLFAGIDLGEVDDVDDDQLAGGDRSRDVRRGRRRCRRAERGALGGTIQNDMLKEYQAQKEYVFPPRPVAADRHRHDPLLLVGNAAVPCRFGLGLPHPRGRIDGGPGAGLHARERVRLRRGGGGGRAEGGRVRAETELLLQRPPRFLRGDREVPSGAPDLGAAGCASATGAELRSLSQLRFHTQTAGASLTAQQPEVNIVRTAIEALAGVLGGTQSLHTNSMDEVFALPTEQAARIALRTQQVIAHETGVTNVADPLGGSWFVEALTDELEREAEAVFAYLDELGEGSMLEGV